MKSFDWPGFFVAIGEPTAEIAKRDHAAMGKAVQIICAWLLKVHPTGRTGYHTIARRVIGLAWTLDPSLIEGSPSLAGIAKELGCNKVVLSIHSASAHRRFGIRNRAQSHGWNYRPTPSAQSTKGEDEHDT